MSLSDTDSITITGCVALIWGTIILTQFSKCEMRCKEVDAQVKQGVQVEKQK